MNWVEVIFNHMILSKENQSASLPYGEIITKLLETFNVSTMNEVVNWTNHKITYNGLREIKILVKME